MYPNYSKFRRLTFVLPFNQQSLNFWYMSPSVLKIRGTEKIESNCVIDQPMKIKCFSGT